MDTAGLGGSLRLGKEAAPGGADMGAEDVYGLGGMTGAEVGGDGLLPVDDVGEASDCSLAARPEAESGVVSPDDTTAGELRDMALDRKSVYAEGGLMGVLMKSGSGLQWKLTADRGVAVVAEEISEGNVAVTGVESFSSLGLTAGMMARLAMAPANELATKKLPRSEGAGGAKGRSAWVESEAAGASRPRGRTEEGTGILYRRKKGRERREEARRGVGVCVCVFSRSEVKCVYSQEEARWLEQVEERRGSGGKGSAVFWICADALVLTSNGPPAEACRGDPRVRPGDRGQGPASGACLRDGPSAVLLLLRTEGDEGDPRGRRWTMDDGQGRGSLRA